MLSSGLRWPDIPRAVVSSIPARKTSEDVKLTESMLAESSEALVGGTRVCHTVESSMCCIIVVAALGFRHGRQAGRTALPRNATEQDRADNCDKARLYTYGSNRHGKLGREAQCR